MVLSIAPVSGIANIDFTSVKASAEFWGGFEYDIDDEEVIITGYDEDVISGDVVFEGYPVTGIGSDLFYENYEITSVVIPNSVKTIFDCAFQECNNLKTVTIGKNVETIDDYAFDECPALESVSIPDSVTFIGNEAFSECTSLKSIVLGNSVETIDDYAFDECTALESVNIPDSVKEINDCAFENCTSLTSIAIPAVAPTCTIAGSTEGSKRSVCGEILVATKAVSATGHTNADNNGKCDTCGASMGNSGERSTSCSHICHPSSKFLQFFRNVFNFFNKLFHTNQYCDCGIAHY